MRFFDVFRVGGVDQNTEPHENVACADFCSGEIVITGGVIDFVNIVVFVDHYHRHEAIARFRQGDPHRSRVEIEHSFGIKRVAIGTHNDPFDRQIAKMDKLAERTLLDDEREVHVGLGPVEVVGRDRNDVLRLRNGWRSKRQSAQ